MVEEIEFTPAPDVDSHRLEETGRHLPIVREGLLSLLRCDPVLYDEVAQEGDLPFERNRGRGRRRSHACETSESFDQLGVEEEQANPNASFVDDLNADSLDLVELIMSIEEEFSTDGKQLEISDEDAEKIQTVQDAIDYVHDQGVEDD